MAAPGAGPSVEVWSMEALESKGSEVDLILVRLRKASPKVTGGLLRVRQAAYGGGLFPAKVKALTALTLSVAIRCEPCIEMYVERAVEEGATFEEVVEFLNVAMAMQGCPGEAWALKALTMFDNRENRRLVRPDAGEPDTCCDE